MQETDVYDPAFVKSVFDRCSEKYIAFSYVASLGFTERWRRQCVAKLDKTTSPSPIAYDLMAGTGEVWPHLLKKYPDLGSITAIDLSSGMHRRAIERLHTHRAHRIDFIEDDVLASDLPDSGADFVVSTFGLKTFNREQHAKLAKLLARVLKSGGSFSLIEASDPKGWFLRPLYNFHLHTVLPLIERFFLKGAQDFAMIGTYTANFGNAAAFADMLRAEGLEVRFQKHFFGCATSVSGHKPDPVHSILRRNGHPVERRAASGRCLP
ncbi:class I SAM-dependent methyltransferase [Parvularcula sp. LCG005]|uniref:class I SAM-dependent methyltransferase n=1 Tax=Parvularcula sp. LCG005 TaxID=3078805 RepID=UPI002942E458|nr:class I SAM-dependent methyltransferase [Parvularcula sp. LCG005]WOI54770.1 class I SAM-dependent methyltransferase [Parvularcula sp. LCG005]